MTGACTGGGDDAAAPPSSTTATATTQPATGSGPPEGTLRVVDVAAAELTPLAAATDGQSLWLAGSSPRGEGGRVTKVDMVAGKLAWSVDVPDSVVGLAVDSYGVVWAVGGGDGADPDGGITRLDATSGRVQGTLVVPGGSPYGVAVGTRPGAWVTDAGSDRVWRVSDRGSITATVRVAEGPTGIASAGESLWVTSPGPGVVTRLDAATGAHRGTLEVPVANSVVANASAVWVGGEALIRLDPTTGARAGAIPTEGVATVHALSFGWVWAKRVGGAVVRGDVEGLRFDPLPVATGEFVVVVVAGDKLWVSEGGRVVEWQLPLRSELDFPAEELHDGVSFGYLRDVGGDEVTFDPAEALTDPEATKVAVTDGVGVTEEEGLPGGFYDRNRAGDTYRLRLSADAALLLLKQAADGFVPTPVDRATFHQARADGRGHEFYGLPGSPYHVTVNNGVVTRIQQVYRP